MPVETGISGSQQAAEDTAAIADQTDQVEGYLATLASTVQVATPGELDPAITVRTINPNLIAAVPPVGTTGQVVWAAQLGENPYPDASDVPRLGVVVVDPVRQGLADRGNPWYVTTTADGITPEQVATAANQRTMIALKTREAVTGHGEQRVAARHEIFSFVAGLVENTEILGFAGTGTHGIDTTRRAQRISISGASGETQSLQSHTRYPLPASVPVAVYGVVMFSDAGQPNQVRRIQLGEDDDYLALCFDGTDVSIEILSALSGVPVLIPRASWLDPLDGSGPSGFTIDWTASNTIEMISGVPGASAGGASINGIKIIDFPAYMNVAGILKRSTHPIRAVITNTGVSAPGSIYVRAFSIHALGDYKFPTRVRAAPATFATKNIGSTFVPLIAIRASTTLGGMPYRGFAYPREITVANKTPSTGLEVVFWRNPTSLTGASWVQTAADSGIEYDVSASAADLAGARSLKSLYVPAASFVNVDLTAVFEEHFVNLIRVRTDGVSDVIVVMARSLISSSDATVGLVIDEVFA